LYNNPPSDEPESDSEDLHAGQQNGIEVVLPLNEDEVVILNEPRIVDNDSHHDRPNGYDPNEFRRNAIDPLDDFDDDALYQDYLQEQAEFYAEMNADYAQYHDE
jgi:hypothetical protein